jgi:hypothetical protein
MKYPKIGNLIKKRSLFSSEFWSFKDNAGFGLNLERTPWLMVSWKEEYMKKEKNHIIQVRRQRATGVTESL